MATTPSIPPSTTSNNLFAAVDMGTNSFKLLIVRADPTTGRFLTLDRFKHPVLLGLSTSTTTISSASQLRAIDSLRQFQQIVHSHHIPASHLRFVATSAVRESTNQFQFLHHVQQVLGLKIEVLSGYDEARLIYLGILQFHPVYSSQVLTIDIGGGSTEFVIGKSGKVLFATSLKLGHVTLTQQFVKNNEIQNLREHIRNVIIDSGLIESVKDYGYHIAIGSSGTIRAIEKAIFHRYGCDLDNTVGIFDGYRREWRFCKEELRGVVETLCGEEEGVREKVQRDGFFKRRSEFIVAGAILLEEIFGMLGIEELEVSGYALGEGLIAEKLAKDFVGYDLNVNARWRSVMGLATRFNNKKRMKAAALCSVIAKELSEGLKKLNELDDDKKKLIDSLDDKDLEYLEAACLLHNIGLFTGQKGYHKQSYRLIMDGKHLHGYNAEEVKLIALLARHHRKKFPKFGHGSLEGFQKEVKQKFRILCVVIRLSVVLTQYESINIQDIKLSNSEGLKLVLQQIRNQPLSSAIVQPPAADIEEEVRTELENFQLVLKQRSVAVVLSSSSESSGQ